MLIVTRVRRIQADLLQYRSGVIIASLTVAGTTPVDTNKLNKLRGETSSAHSFYSHIGNESRGDVFGCLLRISLTADWPLDHLKTCEITVILVTTTGRPHPTPRRPSITNTINFHFFENDANASALIMLLFDVDDFRRPRILLIDLHISRGLPLCNSISMLPHKK